MAKNALDQVGVLIIDQNQTTLVFDATTTSEHRLQAEVTSNPIESNSGDVTDHRRVKPQVWSFTAVLVDEADPNFPNRRSAAATDAGNDVLQSARENGPQVERRAKDSLAFLREIFEDSKTVRVDTDVETIENAVLESLTYRVLASLPAPNFKAEPSAIEVSGTFREVRFASTEIVPVPKDPVKKQQGKILIYGPPAPETASDALKGKANSVAEQLFGF